MIEGNYKLVKLNPVNGSVTEGTLFETRWTTNPRLAWMKSWNEGFQNGDDDEDDDEEITTKIYILIFY